MDRRQFTVAAALGLATTALLAQGERSEAQGLPGIKHPMMHKALEALEAAKAELESARHDFGGHRKAALEAIHRAHEQIKICLKYEK